MASNFSNSPSISAAFDSTDKAVWAIECDGCKEDYSTHKSILSYIVYLSGYRSVYMANWQILQKKNWYPLRLRLFPYDIQLSHRLDYGHLLPSFKGWRNQSKVWYHRLYPDKLVIFAGYEGMEEIVDRQCNTKISVNLKISDESIFITHIRCWKNIYFS